MPLPGLRGRNYSKESPQGRERVGTLPLESSSPQPWPTLGKPRGSQLSTQPDAAPGTQEVHSPLLSPEILQPEIPVIIYSDFSEAHHHYVTQTSLKLTVILLPQLREYWDWRCDFFSGTLQTTSSSSFHRFLVLLHFLLSLSLNKFMYLLIIWYQYGTQVLCSLRLSSRNKIHGTSNSHSVAQVGPEFSAIFLTWLLRTGVTSVNYLIPQPLVHFHSTHLAKHPSVVLSRRNVH